MSPVTGLARLPERILRITEILTIIDYGRVLTDCCVNFDTNDYHSFFVTKAESSPYAVTFERDCFC